MTKACNICLIRARWRENRTIFNTPNPRLANASLLKEVTSKQQPGSRRGSLTKNGSRQPSLASIPRALDASGSFDIDPGRKPHLPVCLVLLSYS